MFYKKTILIISCVFLVFGIVGQSQAAKLYLSAEERSFLIGDEISVYVKVNTELEGINATEALISFPTNALEVLSIEKESSIFNFWLEGPDYSNESGTISFIGGTPKGVSGQALQLLRINFIAKGAGSVDILVNDAVVTASDGKGTNILSLIEGINIGIGVETLPPQQAPIIETEEVEVPIENPERVEREPVLVGDKPEAPVLDVPLYPDPSKWYDHVGDMVVFWQLPNDIIKIATQIDSNPAGDPQNIEEELFTGKNFGSFAKDGVWYVHAQFKNNIGWGERTHYRISLDMTPPMPFEIEIDNVSSKNPAPEIYFETHDSLSGIAYYHVFPDDKDPLKTESNSIVLPIQAPGKHSVRVKAVDFAGNRIEDVLEFEILPLATPTIDFLTKTVSHHDSIFASGKAVPEAFVDVYLSDENGQDVFSGEAEANELGNWKITIEDILLMGDYSMTVTARDARGAVSYPSESRTVTVKGETIISFGMVELGWIEIMIISALIVISAASIAGWYYVSTKKTREAYRVIVGRDIEKFSVLIAKDIKKMNSWMKKQRNNISAKDLADAEQFLKSLGVTATKIKKYLIRPVKKLK